MDVQPLQFEYQTPRQFPVANIFQSSTLSIPNPSFRCQGNATIMSRQTLITNLIFDLSQPQLNLKLLPGESEPIHCIDDNLYTMYFVLCACKEDGTKKCNVQQLVNLLVSYENKFGVSFDVMVLKAKTTCQLIFCLYTNFQQQQPYHIQNHKELVIDQKCHRHIDTTYTHGNCNCSSRNIECVHEWDIQRVITNCLKGTIVQYNKIHSLNEGQTLECYKIHARLDEENKTYDLYEIMNRLQELVCLLYCDDYVCYIAEDWLNTDPNHLTMYLQWYEYSETDDISDTSASDCEYLEKGTKVPQHCDWLLPALSCTVIIIAAIAAFVMRYHVKYWL